MYFSLDKRCQEILQRIMYAKGYSKIQDIADEMHVSRRSVYYDLSKINEWLEAQDIKPLNTERNKGVFASWEQVQEIQTALDRIDHQDLLVFTPDERTKIEICAIIIRSKPLYIENFMELCQVSRNTIINDLKVVSSFLEHYTLELTYDIKLGYRIIGDPIKKRAVFFMLFPHLWEYEKQKTIQLGNDSKMGVILTKLKRIEQQLNVEYTQEMLPTLAMFLTSVDKRNDEFDYWGMDKDEIQATKEYGLVELYFSHLKEVEKVYVTLHLLGARLQTIPVNVMNEQGQVYHYSKMLVHEFERLSCIYFDQEEELILAINAHLKTSLYRYRYGIQLGNPLLDSIKTEYEELFELTRKSCACLESELGCLISDAEVAYLTLHFGAFLNRNKEGKSRSLRIAIICPNGIGTGNMLRSEVAALVPQATEIVNIPLSQYRENHAYDVVISTIVLPREKKLIVVHPILTDQDKVTILRNCMYTEPEENMRIQEIIELASSYIDPERLPDFQKDLQEYYSSIQIRKAPHRDFGKHLIHYLTPSHVQICREECTWKEAIKYSCEPLLKEGSITTEYVEAILHDQQERGLGMFLADGLVLAHAAIEKGVHKLDVALSVFKKPVTFLNGNQAQIIITLCAEDQIKHIRVLKDVLTIFSKKKSKEKLISLSTASEICQYIERSVQEAEIESI